MCVVESSATPALCRMSFDILAPFYRWMEAVLAGGLLQRCRIAHLVEIRDCRNALLLGEGPGKFLIALLRANPHIDVTCVEQSSRMIAVARRHLQKHGLDLSRVRFERCDALAWRPTEEKFDLVATHFFLDCFPPEQLGPLIAKIAARTTCNARWLVTDFQVPERGWRRSRAKATLALMYSFFRIVTHLPASRLTPPDGLLRAHGFQLDARRIANLGLVHSDLWQRDEP